MLDQTIDNAIIEKPTQREYLLQALQQLEMQAAELGVTHLLKAYVDIYRLLYLHKPTQREYLLQALQQLEMQAAELGVTYLLKTYVDIYRLLYLSESTTVNSSLQGYT